MSSRPVARKRPRAARLAASTANPAPAFHRVMIVDDHPITRMGLTQVINSHPGLVVCMEAGEPVEAMALLAHDKPDLVITDLSMPGTGGLELIKNINALYPGLAVLVVSMHDELLHAERVLHAGARGYVMKEAGGEMILQAIDRVLTGQVFVSPAMAEKIFHIFAHRGPATLPMETLTDRELEVLELLGQGKTSKEIGAQLHLSSKTVDAHRWNLKQKLRCPDSMALMRFAVCWFEEERRQSPAKPAREK